MVEFDQRKAVLLEGVVTKVEWLNPHTYFYVDLRDQSGRRPDLISDPMVIGLLTYVYEERKCDQGAKLL